MPFCLRIFIFSLVTHCCLYSIEIQAQEKNDYELYKREQQQKLDDYRSKQNKEIEAYKKKQQEEIDKLRKQYLKYEKEREAEIASFRNKNLVPELVQKADDAEKTNQLIDEVPQDIIVEDKEESKEEIIEPIIEIPIAVSPQPVVEEKKEMEVDANRPVFFPIHRKYPITSHYNLKRVHPVLKKVRPHYGIDFGAPKGTPVYATADGIVEIARFSNSAGNWVMINHQNGYKTIYMHFEKLVAREGKQVKRGDIIGYVGSTGYSSGPHLHYEVRYNNKSVNPINFLLYEMG